MRLVTILVALSVAILTFSLPLAQGQENGPAQSLFQSANRERVAHGLAPLNWSATLAGAAHQHALRMAAQNTLSHQLPGEPGMADRSTQAGAGSRSLAEKVAGG